MASLRRDEAVLEVPEDAQLVLGVLGVVVLVDDAQFSGVARATGRRTPSRAEDEITRLASIVVKFSSRRSRTRSSANTDAVVNHVETP